MTAPAISVNALPPRCWPACSTTPSGCASRRARDDARRHARRRGHRGPGQHRGRPARSPKSAWAASARCAWPPASDAGWPTWLRGAQLAAGARLPGQPVRRLEPRGEQGGDGRQEVLRARLGAGARARLQGGPVRANSATATAATRGVLVLEVDRVAAAGGRRQGAARLRARAARRSRIVLTPDDQPRRHDAGGGPRAGGGAAQGARAGLRARRTSSRAAAARRCRRRAPTRSRRWAAPTTPSSTAARCTSPCGGEADAARDLASGCRRRTRATTDAPSRQLFDAADHDFYKIDRRLFAPAEVWVSHLESGRTWHAGRQRWTCCSAAG